MSGRVVIIGAGHAGGTAAAMLRQFGYAGDILLAGDEPIHPYQRPPLSKAWLKGEVGAEELELKGHEFYTEHGIELRLGVTATAIERGAKCVVFEGGAREPYDDLIIATGARARALPIPGADLSGVLCLRTAAHADELKAALGKGKRLVVVGGGYIGLEVAASARVLGCDVTVLEREHRVLARVASQPLSDFFQRHHVEQGVRILTGATVEGFEGEGGRLTAVRLKGGETFACDVALVGVGAQPNIELAQDCGLECADGVVVDLEARTRDPHVFAIGDVTHRPMPLYDRNMRLESVPSALEQAKQAAAAITGHAPPPAEVPWFWSDQYDVKLQIAGVPFDSDTLVIRGDPAANAFAVFHLHGRRVMAVEAVNVGAEFMGGRLLIGKKAEVDPERLADLSVPMKAMLAE